MKPIGISDDETDAREARGPLDVLKKKAESVGWHCLTERWSGYKARYRFICAYGHRFQRQGNYILYGSRSKLLCPFCRGGTPPVGADAK